VVPVEPICIQGRTVTSQDLSALRALIAEHPEWHRTAISRQLCALWNWRNGAGRPKDMAARTLLLKLHARGLIELPPPQTRTRRACASTPEAMPPELLAPAPAPIEQGLGSLRPVRLEAVSSRADRRRVHALLAQYHYRGFNGAAGENIQYLARDAQGREWR
jgi:hypothetical protein